MNYICAMKKFDTFEFPIPARTFIANGGNIMQKDIVTECNTKSTRHRIQTIEGDRTILNLTSEKGLIKTHIDMCWVIANINI